MAAGRRYTQRYGRGGARALGFRMAMLAAVSMLPDADVVTFRLGIAYGAPFGHRGASHSLVAAAIVGVIAGLCAAWQAPAGAGRARGSRVGAFAGLVMATHGVLDALTDGGLGVALLWPFSLDRLFLPWRPIPVAPIGLGAMLGPRGLIVAGYELVFFAPLVAYALLPRRRRGPRSPGPTA